MTAAEKAQEAAREIRLATNHLSRSLFLLEESAMLGSVSPATLVEVVESIEGAEYGLGLALAIITKVLWLSVGVGHEPDAPLPPAGGVMR